MSSKHSSFRLRGFLRADGSVELVFGSNVHTPVEDDGSTPKTTFDVWLEQSTVSTPYAMQDSPVAAIESPAIPEAPLVPDVPVEAPVEPTAPVEAPADIVG